MGLLIEVGIKTLKVKLQIISNHLLTECFCTLIWQPWYEWEECFKKFWVCIFRIPSGFFNHLSKPFQRCLKRCQKSQSWGKLSVLFGLTFGRRKRRPKAGLLWGSGNIQELRGTRKLFLALFYMVSIRKSDRYKIKLLIEGVYSKFQFEIWNIVSTTPSIDK